MAKYPVTSTPTQSSKTPRYPDEYTAKNHQLQMFKTVIDECGAMCFMYRNHPVSNVVDAGCGDGKVTSVFWDKYLSVKIPPPDSIVAFDLNPSFIKNATAKYGDRIRFDVCDITDEEKVMKLYSGQKFDVVTSFMALHWTNFPKALRIISECLLKPNGKFVMTVSVAQSCKYMLHITAIMAKKYPEWATYINDFKKIKASNYGLGMTIEDEISNVMTDMRPTFEECGLGIDVIEYPMVTCKYSDSDEMRDVMKNLLSEVGIIPEDKVDQYMNDYAKEYLNVYGSAKAQFPIMYAQLYKKGQ
ncbi:juvenile hormone acid O-methyltransferase-like [Tubulanus polymorphus]|uniref:juvenile hormone acid O-methyltransferase-like n=1 Tax=Tubulanus polymorphus TaxID=672921 RepID=UPI003DA5CB6B